MMRCPMCAGAWPCAGMETAMSRLGFEEWSATHASYAAAWPHDWRFIAAAEDAADREWWIDLGGHG